MNNSRNWVGIAAVIVVAVVSVLFRNTGTPTQPQTYTHAPSASSSNAYPASGSATWSHGYDGSTDNAEEHWQKHGNEFPDLHSEQDYVNAANAFIHHPPSDVQIKHDDRGDTLFYQTSTDTFAVMDRRGEPRTFFKPDDGERYWDKQCCGN